MEDSKVGKDGGKGAAHGKHTVLLLDEDPLILNDLECLLTAKGYRVRSYLEVEKFFLAGLPAEPACLIVETRLKNGMTGAQVHAEVQRRGWFIPTVFATAHWNLQTVVEAMRSGVHGCLTKPFDPAELIAAVVAAQQRSLLYYQDAVLAVYARERACTLTAREGEIVQRVSAGWLNRDVAADLNISIETVKTDRSHAMRKMGAGNVVRLAHLAMLADIRGQGPAT